VQLTDTYHSPPPTAEEKYTGWLNCFPSLPRNQKKGIPDDPQVASGYADVNNKA